MTCFELDMIVLLSHLSNHGCPACGIFVRSIYGVQHARAVASVLYSAARSSTRDFSIGIFELKALLKYNN
jgi:hypothetical protein